MKRPSITLVLQPRGTWLTASKETKILGLHCFMQSPSSSGLEVVCPWKNKKYGKEFIDIPQWYPFRWKNIESHLKPLQNPTRSLGRLPSGQGSCETHCKDIGTTSGRLQIGAISGHSQYDRSHFSESSGNYKTLGRICALWASEQTACRASGNRMQSMQSKMPAFTWSSNVQDVVIEQAHFAKFISICALFKWHSTFRSFSTIWNQGSLSQQTLSLVSSPQAQSLQ